MGIANDTADALSLGEQRRHRRRPVLWKGHADISKHRLECRVFNITPGGMLARLDLPLAPGAALTVTLPQASRPLLAKVAWSHGTLHGLSFNEAESRILAAFNKQREALGFRMTAKSSVIDAAQLQ